VSKTQAFFEQYLPNKLEKKPDLAASVNAVYQFDITGAGTWTVDLKTPGGAVRSGPSEAPGCVITCAQEHWEGVLGNPSSAMMLVMSGKLKVSNVALGMQLQKLLA
jgi:putative sterol carrier protein